MVVSERSLIFLYLLPPRHPPPPQHTHTYTHSYTHRLAVNPRDPFSIFASGVSRDTTIIVTLLFLQGCIWDEGGRGNCPSVAVTCEHMNFPPPATPEKSFAPSPFLKEILNAAFLFCVSDLSYHL
jgi:hypothetical protein